MPALSTQKTFKEITEVSETLSSPARAIVVECRKVNRCVQQDVESVKGFTTELKLLERDCNFEVFPNYALRDWLLAGWRDEETLRVLFATGNLSVVLTSVQDCA